MMFHPIANVKLPGFGSIPLDGLTVIVGPNSSGKTQLLQDVEHAINGRPRKLVVAEEIAIRKPSDLDSFLDMLEKGGDIKFGEGGSRTVIKKISPILGVGGGIADIKYQDLRNYLGAYLSVPPNPRELPKVDFYQQLGSLFATVLFLGNRFQMVAQKENFDYEKSAPQNDFQMLYMNRAAQAQVEKEVLKTFGKKIWLDATRGNILCLRIAEGSDDLTPMARYIPEVVRNFRTIDQEGDGLKSFVGIAISLVLARRPVYLIDEPETCLHPPQAFALGKLIGAISSRLNSSTLVSTHSSHILRGIIESTDKVRIIRLTKSKSGFSAKHVDQETMKNSIINPRLKAETILDGIFSDAVILVESEGDRQVYEAVWEKMSDNFPFDIRFSSTGGKNGFADIIKFYKVLEIPVFIISDIDFLLDISVVQNVLGSLSEQDGTDIIKSCRSIRQILSTIKPNVTLDEARSRIDLLFRESENENLDLDAKIARELSNLSDGLRSSRRLKRGGIKELSQWPVLKEKCTEVISALDGCGVFVVDVGELEYWLGIELGDQVSKKNKPLWAHNAALYIRKNSIDGTDIQEFMKKVLDVVRKKLNK